MFAKVIAALSLLAATHQLVSAQLHFSSAGPDPYLVGYITGSDGGYSTPRSCDYPMTASTSGAYVQCCSATVSCPFYTSCSSNTLLAASGTPVACDAQATLSCNTGLIVSTAGATSAASYLACWQTSLGNGPFTIVKNIGTAAVATPASASTATATASSNSGATSSQMGAITTPAPSSSRAAGSITSLTGAATSSTSGTSSSNGAATAIAGGILGAVGIMAQALL